MINRLTWTSHPIQVGLVHRELFLETNSAMTHDIGPATLLHSAQDCSTRTNHPIAHTLTRLDQNQESTDETNEQEVRHLTSDKD